MNEKSEQLSDRFLNFAANIIKIADALPQTVARKHIGGQLIKVGTSGGSNYEEACGAESRSDFTHKMSIVLKELKESRFWLRLIRRARMLEQQSTDPVITECEQLCAITAKSILTAKKNKNYSKMTRKKSSVGIKD